MKEEDLTIDQIAEIIHKAIDNTAVAEDEYPSLKERLHMAVESECERLNSKACRSGLKFAQINKSS